MAFESHVTNGQSRLVYGLLGLVLRQVKQLRNVNGRGEDRCWEQHQGRDKVPKAECTHGTSEPEERSLAPRDSSDALQPGQPTKALDA
jgi:hypothetical protein